MSISVSIIEDDPPAEADASGQRWINQAKGFHCVSKHANAASALMQLPQEKPDIVLVDINLPDISGIQCVERLKPLLKSGKHFVNAYGLRRTLITFSTPSRRVPPRYLLKETSRDQLIMPHSSEPESTRAARP